MKISFVPSLCNLYRVHAMVAEHMMTILDNQHGGVLNGESFKALTEELLSHDDWVIKFDSLEEAQKEVVEHFGQLLRASSWELGFQNGLVIRRKEVKEPE